MIVSIFRKAKLMVVLAMVGILALTGLGVSAAESQQAQPLAEITGTVKAVDASTGAVTILGANAAEVTIKVVGTTRVEIKGVLLGVLGVAAGMEARARYNPATGEATALKVRQQHPRSDGQTRATGTITGVNAATGEVALQLKDGSALTVKTSADTKIMIDGKASTLADLKVGATANVLYKADTKVASAIRVGTGDQKERDKKAKGAEVHGAVQSVDPAQHKLALKLRDGSTKELALTGDTVIRIGGKVSSEADLKAGMQVEVRYDPDTNTALRINAPKNGPDREKERGKSEEKGEGKGNGRGQGKS